MAKVKTKLKSKSRTKYSYVGNQVLPDDTFDEELIREVAMTTTESERHLYVPNPKTVSWEAQVDHAHRIMREGVTVFVHRHGWGDRCKTNVGPDESCMTTDLTSPTESPKLVPVSDGESQSTQDNS